MSNSPSSQRFDEYINSINSRGRLGSNEMRLLNLYQHYDIEVNVTDDVLIKGRLKPFEDDGASIWRFNLTEPKAISKFPSSVIKGEFPGSLHVHTIHYLHLLKHLPSTVGGDLYLVECGINDLTEITNKITCITGNHHCTDGLKLVVKNRTLLQKADISSLAQGGLLNLSKNRITSGLMSLFNVQGLNQVVLDDEVIRKIMNNYLLRRANLSSVYPNSFTQVSASCYIDCQSELIDQGYDCML